MLRSSGAVLLCKLGGASWNLGISKNAFLPMHFGAGGKE